MVKHGRAEGRDTEPEHMMGKYCVALDDQVETQPNYEYSDAQWSEADFIWVVSGLDFATSISVQLIVGICRGIIRRTQNHASSVFCNRKIQSSS